VPGDLRAVTHLDRPFLHAARLAFKHPADGRRMEFTSRCPTIFSASSMSSGRNMKLQIDDAD